MGYALFINMYKKTNVKCPSDTNVEVTRRTHYFLFWPEMEMINLLEKSSFVTVKLVTVNFTYVIYWKRFI